MKNKYTAAEWMKRGIIPCPLQVIRDFAPVRERVRRAVEQSPKHVTFDDALRQVRSFQR